jgi:hypothetical protein
MSTQPVGVVGARVYWSRLTPEQRSEEMKRRQKVAARKRAMGIPSKPRGARGPYKLKQPIVERGPIGMPTPHSLKKRLQAMLTNLTAIQHEIEAVGQILGYDDLHDRD